MRWLWGLPLIPFLICGGICFGGVIVAFVAGRWSAKGSEPARDPTTTTPEEVSSDG